MHVAGNYWVTTDPVKLLHDAGATWNRVCLRMPHVPPDPDPWCTIDYSEAVLNASARDGMHLDVFMFLSDKAANGGAQELAGSLRGLSFAQRADALRNYTRDTAARFSHDGLNVETYEIGNEITFGVAGLEPTPGHDVFDFDYLRQDLWANESILLKAAAEGIREAAPHAKVVLHIVAIGQEYVAGFFQFMIEAGVPFDLAGLSYYPSTNFIQPHQATTQAGLDEAVERIAAMGKPTVISEFAYPSSPCNCSDISIDRFLPEAELTPEGQATALAETLRMAYANPHIVGLFYFYPDNFLSETDPDIHAGPHAALFFDDHHAKPALRELSPDRWRLPISLDAPHAELRQPMEGASTNGSSALVEGSTDPGVRVTVEGEAIHVADDGHFATTWALHSTNATLRVVFAAPWGGTTMLTRTITNSPMAPTPPPPPPPTPTPTPATPTSPTTNTLTTVSAPSVVPTTTLSQPTAAAAPTGTPILSGTGATPKSTPGPSTAVSAALLVLGAALRRRSL